MMFEKNFKDLTENMAVSAFLPGANSEACLTNKMEHFAKSS